MSSDSEQKEEIINSIEEDKDLLMSSSEPEFNDEHGLAENNGEALNEEPNDIQNDNNGSPSAKIDDSEASKNVELSVVKDTVPKPIQADQVEIIHETPKSPELDEPAEVIEEQKTEEQTKEQARLKKLEEARKKIERLKNKKNINSSQSKESTPLKEDNLNKSESDEGKIITEDDKLPELQNAIANLNNIIKEKDSEIVKLKAELIKEKQLNKDLQSQIKTPSSTYVNPQSVSYETIDFNKWKNYKIDMSEWRSIGSGPIVQF